MATTRHLKSIEEVIDALGGNRAAVQLAGLQAQSAASMWKARGRLPPTSYKIMMAKLKRRRCTAPAELWGMT